MGSPTGTPDRTRLRQITRAPHYKVSATKVDGGAEGALEFTRWQLRMGDEWTVPAVEIAPAAPESTVVLVADEGRSSLVSQIEACLARRQRVIAIDPFYFGESRIPKLAGLWAILVAAVGERPLGIQAGQIAATARWLQTARQLGPVTVISVGPRSSLFALVAAGIEQDAILGLEQFGAMSSLKEILV